MMDGHSTKVTSDLQLLYILNESTNFFYGYMVLAMDENREWESGACAGVNMVPRSGFWSADI